MMVYDTIIISFGKEGHGPKSYLMLVKFFTVAYAPIPLIFSILPILVIFIKKKQDLFYLTLFMHNAIRLI